MADDILVYDGTGRHPAPSVAVQLASAGKSVTFAALDPVVAPEMETHSQIIYRKRFAELGVQTLLEYEIVRVSPNGDRYDVSLTHLLTGQGLVLACSQVVVENGTYPVTDVFDELRPLSANDGRTELSSLTGPAPLRPRRDDGFELHRIGDAVTSRSVHAAMFDAVRLCIQF